MNLSGPFVRRPIATILLTVGIALAGIAAFFVLPVAPGLRAALEPLIDEVRPHSKVPHANLQQTVETIFWRH